MLQYEDFPQWVKDWLKGTFDTPDVIKLPEIRMVLFHSHLKHPRSITPMPSKASNNSYLSQVWEH